MVRPVKVSTGSISTHALREEGDDIDKVFIFVV